MSDAPELPTKFQDEFEVEKAEAEREYETRGGHIPYSLRFAVIRRVFFAYCTYARNACRAGAWTLAQVRGCVKAAWPIICDSYAVGAEVTAEEPKLWSRAVYWREIEDDPQWQQHLNKLAALAGMQRVRKAQPARAPAIAETRPPGIPVDGKRLREYRDPYTQADFADKCGIHLSTYQRGERGGRWDAGTFVKVASTISTLTETTVEPEDLHLKKPQKSFLKYFAEIPAGGVMQSIDLHEPGNHRVVVGPERAVRIPYRFRPSPEGAWVTLQPAPHVHAHEIEKARALPAARPPRGGHSGREQKG